MGLMRVAGWWWVALLVVGGAASLQAANPGGYGPQAAREQLKALQVAEGLEVTLFAAEPMVRNPANMDIDARGRVWCTEGVNYRSWQRWGRLQPAGDRIVVCPSFSGNRS